MRPSSRSHRVRSRNARVWRQRQLCTRISADYEGDDDNPERSAKHDTGSIPGQQSSDGGADDPVISNPQRTLGNGDVARR
jgi:hypothetical protein